MECNGSSGFNVEPRIPPQSLRRRRRPSAIPSTLEHLPTDSLRFVSLCVPINLMRRRPTMKPSMARLSFQDIGWNARRCFCSAVPVSCFFFLIAFCASLFVFLNPKNPETEVVAIMATPTTPAVALPSHEPPLPTERETDTKTETTETDTTTTTTQRARENETSPVFKQDKRCAGRYIYVHNLPRRFNSDMLRSCGTISRWTDMCLFTSNAGLGPKLDNSGGAFFGRGWYATNQFALEVIFHNRMKQYDCLTPNSSLAAAIFVPYYAGLDISRYLWDSTAAERDEAPRALIRWLRSRAEWSAMRGKDHFMVAGRITWDFQRPTDDDEDWGNKLLLTPEVKHMTVLVIESSPWLSHDFGIPYPTYFHPSNDGEVRTWQDRMRRMKRPWLFSFAGGARPGGLAWIRNEVMGQCRKSRRCKLLECGIGNSQCHLPGTVMKLFEKSTFCLQPQGDSYTRRSLFDAMVAGCVPVFFHPGSAYVQYTWHLPKNYSKYSVFIGEDEVRRGGRAGSVEEVLKRIKKKDVKAMREEVIKMIPRLVYADPRARGAPVKDAFDLAVEGVIKRVKGIKAGNAPVFVERESWKHGLVGTKEINEWDHFFGHPRRM